MTVSATVEVSDSLDEARTRLLRTARALNGAWAAALCSMALLVVGSTVLLLVALTIRPVYVVIWSVLLAAAAYNLTRFWPRRRQRPGQRLSRSEAAALRGEIDPDGVVAWPDVVRLVPRVELELSEGELVLGMPLLACLDGTELHELLVLASKQASVEGDRSVRWALRVAHGDIGRPLVGRRPRTWPTVRLTEIFGQRAAQLEADLDNWAGACERASVRASRETAAVVRCRDQVADAWALVRSEWLEPAFDRGCRHVAPFTGLRRFVEGAEAAGWMDLPRPWWPSTGVVADIVGAYEEPVALELDARRGRLQPITWEQHAAEVTVPQWRALVTDILDAARRTTDDPAVTLDTLLRLWETGEGAGLLGTATSRTLTAAIGTAAVDSLQFKVRWAWPEGTALQADDGWVLPLETIVSEVLGMVRDGDGRDKAYAELREALHELGIDVDEPLWLDHDTERPERPVGSFGARQGIAARVVVVTDRALHLFRDTPERRVGNPERPAAPRNASVELRRRMLMVWQGDMTEQVLVVPAADVRRARFGPAVGGLWWRLTLTGTRGTVILRGRGDGAEVASEIREWLGDRVETVWLHSPPGIRTLRNAVGLAGMTAGTLALLWGVLLTMARPAGMAPVVPPVLALGGFASLLVALAPDWVLQLRRRIGR